MLNYGRAHVLDAPHLTVFPGLAIAVVVLGLNLWGDGLRGQFRTPNNEPGTVTVRREFTVIPPTSAACLASASCAASVAESSRSASQGT